MISLDLTKSSEVRKAGDRPKYHQMKYLPEVYDEYYNEKWVLNDWVGYPESAGNRVL